MEVGRWEEILRAEGGEALARLPGELRCPIPGAIEAGLAAALGS